MIRPISVSLAPYDGYRIEQALESLAGIGVASVEPAFIVGYTEPFDRTAFSRNEIQLWSARLKDNGLDCHAVSAHIDLGLEDAVEVFRPRMDFARAIGARVINTNASRRDREAQFLRNMDHLLPHAEAIGLRIGFENPGNGEDNLLNLASDGVALLRRLGSPAVGLNFDSANLASHRPEAAVLENTMQALPLCIHYHVKDLARRDDGWHFVAIGRGDIDQGSIMAALRRQPALPISIELPLRLHRGFDAQPIRASAPLPQLAIETVLRDSLDFVCARLSEP